MHAGGGDIVAGSALGYETLAKLAGGKDVPCPLCSSASSNPKKRVLKVWRKAPDFITYSCARCGEHGWASDRGAKPVSRAEIARRMHEAEAHTAAETAKRRSAARWLWSQSVPAAGTIVERYLAARGITAMPPTLHFLPARDEHPAAMLAAFGDPPSAVHITRLAPDSTKLGKIMLGPTEHWPLALTPPNDLGGLAIAEGIETALSVHQATGLGAWAAGAANRLVKLAPVVAELSCIEAVTVFAENDQAGQRGAAELMRELARLRPDIEVRITGDS
jgi:hypothetical protein